MSSTPLSFFHPATLISTWFGSGLIKFAPGTWGSLAALPFSWVIFERFGSEGLIIASVLAYGIGVWSSGKYSKALGKEDPGSVVIDEVAGQWLALAFVPLDPFLYFISFLLFRFFDIVKVFPANWLDRNVKGGLGIMSDDMVAGLYALIVFYLFQRFIPYDGEMFKFF
ncbi:phosphatidylglycerophosphatase A [Kiloniella antarctica]|uniref:Phosphatidylglycerophosphatase A n=1 Tax=Kiloniella antarctica TaxID=1550907 RepID=A0ABW5BR41_9PROT